MRPVTLPPLKVGWSPNNVPQDGDPAQGYITTSRFSARENEIYILGKAGVDTDEFDSHVIVHEWGHFFEQSLSRADNPGGSHGAGDVLDPRVAFGEGYGNALASMLLPESIHVDTAWLGPGGTLSASGFDAETEPSPTDDPHPGPFSERSIQRLLYDLYDSGTSEAHDRVTVDLGTIYDVLVGPQKNKGAWVAGADQNLSGTETFDFHAQTGRRYVVVLTGFKSSPGRYPVSLSITSP